MTSPALPGWSAAAADLPARFLDRRRPTPVPDPYLVAWNPAMAADLGLGVDPGDLVATLSGNLLPEGIAPHAAGYAGHQFGTWVPELGDGRAITIGALPGRDRVLREIQLKGSGMTRWSRMGDGRAVLRSTIREYLASAAMAGLGIPTTGALAITGSDLPVYRERTETAAILTRVSPTFIRFGTFQWLASLGEREAVRQLADSVIERFFPALLALPADERHGAWYAEVVARTARLMAAWIAVGFAHGVMNTDNFSIIGETIDYGPFGWMDRYQPGLVCNHSDWQGRYAFDQQPLVGLWNCSRLGEALHPLVSEPAAVAALEGYHPIYEAEVIRRMRDKLGLITVDDTDAELISDFLDLMQATGADYQRSFRALSRWDAEVAASREALVAVIPDGGRLDAWLARYAARLASEPRPAAQRHAAMLGTNPKYVLRNWVAQDVIENAETRNFAAVDAVRTLLDDPFAEHSTFERFAAGPPAWAREIVVSCSS
jgi:uncharacterized protein YdiU (UPF0061 family)